MSTPAAPQLTEAEDRQYAGLAQILGILGFLPSLIIWLVFKDRGAMTNRMAKEALNFQLTMVGAYIIGWILTFLVIGMFVIMAVGIVTIIFSIIAFTKVQSGEDYKYPLTIRMIK